MANQFIDNTMKR